MNHRLPRTLGLLLLYAGLAHAQAGDGQMRAAPAPTTAAAKTAAPLDDGPYLRYEPQRVIARWVCGGKVVQREIPAPRWPVTVAPQCGYTRAIQVEAPATPDAAATAPVRGVKRIAALSDVHGQYGVMVQLLRANGIVDRKLNWRYGNGHLVIVGDVFDRGPQVNQALWLLYQLERQARKAGGGVHLLLGNHEIMVLANDLRYVNPGYQANAGLLGASYPELYGPDTVLGRWLRSKPVMAQIDDLLFVHGGIAEDYLALGLTRGDANARYRASLGTPKAVWSQDPILNGLYNGKTSPIWYRGYFTDPSLDQARVDAILRKSGARRIVVGHTSMKAVGFYFGGAVISVDSSIKNGESGELLLVDNGRLSRGTMDGQRLPLIAPAAAED
ncbi:MAG: metallophosphoesterase [Lysobacter sp.]|nr:metallophosphoesterase [Lysobacter sp.]